VNALAAQTPLSVLSPKTAPMKRMPTVIDLDFIPDMGRMTLRLQSEDEIGHLLDRMKAAVAPRQSIRSSRAAI
jgi:hypothetical protein